MNLRTPTQCCGQRSNIEEIQHPASRIEYRIPDLRGPAGPLAKLFGVAPTIHDSPITIHLRSATRGPVVSSLVVGLPTGSLLNHFLKPRAEYSSVVAIKGNVDSTVSRLPR
jgi:hypothetical protein